ncbi:MAG: CotH kinase family protein, partial [Deltaproteobacteria bacterium]|nr:CotH kinase family protein [Deltaproteobacteria bacterium]
MWWLGCVQSPPESSPVATDSAPVADSAEEAPGPDAEEWELYSDEAVHRFDITLSDDAINQLAAYPDLYVEGDFTYDGETYSRVGVRLKGSASWQPIDQKPAFRIDFDQFVEGQSFRGHERIGLHNNVWDASAMAETLAYWTWRQADNPAPRTGYADVYVNGELRGLYTLVQPMDGQFVDEWWDGPHG